MTVQELIEALQKLPPGDTVTVWDAFHDCETDEVEVQPGNGKVMITNV